MIQEKKRLFFFIFIFESYIIYNYNNSFIIIFAKSYFKNKILLDIVRYINDLLKKYFEKLSYNIIKFNSFY